MPSVKDPSTAWQPILGFGHHQPERILTNDELSTMVDTNDEWIRTRTGIQTRHIAGPDDSVVSMAVEAGRNAISDAGIDPAEIGLVIVASTTHIERAPHSAGRVVAALGLGPRHGSDRHQHGVQRLRVRDGPRGPVRPDRGRGEKALVIGSEVLSSIADWTDRSTCVLVGDGAGAAVVAASDTTEIGPVSWGSVPHLQEAVLVTHEPDNLHAAGAVDLPLGDQRGGGPRPRGGVGTGLTLDDIEVFAFHQANLRIIETLVTATRR